MLTAVRFYTCLLDEKISVPQLFFFSFLFPIAQDQHSAPRTQHHRFPAAAPGTLTEAHTSRSRQPSWTHLRMSGGKACGKQAAQYTGKQPDEVSVVTRRGAAAAWDMQETAANQGHRELYQHTAAAENEVHSSGHTHRKPICIKEMSAAKQAGGKGETEKGKQPAVENEGTCTTRQATQTQPALLAADATFAAALEAIPAEDWCRTWAAGWTIMLRRTSKRVKEVVDNMRLPAVVRLSWSFWDDARSGTHKAKRQLVMRQLTLMAAWCRISTLELPECDMKGQDAERLAAVLAQCPALAHLDLSDNYNFGSAGAEKLAGVLGQCRELVHLNLWGNKMGNAGAESLAGVLGQCRELMHLNLGHNVIGAGGAGRLAGVLPQCTALAHLNLRDNDIGAGGAERLAGVLGQCRKLVHLNLRGNKIGAGGAERLAGVLVQCPALAYLNLGYDNIGDSGAERLAGVLGQCAALAHLNLYNNQIGEAGAERLAGALPQCAALTHLDLSYNKIGIVGEGMLRASWRGQASGLVL